MAEVFTIIIMVFNLLISLWNAYSVGYNSVALQKYKGKFADFFQIANSFGLVLAFAGAAYSLAYFLSLIGANLGYLSPQVSVLISAYNLVVFGGLIVFSGIIITIESILIAYLQRNFWSIFIAIYNTIASIWNLYAYISSFKAATGIIDSLGGNDDDSKSKAIAVLILAALISIFLVYGFYKFGKDKAKKEIGHMSHQIHHKN
jgi:hypothetical protein